MEIPVIHETTIKTSDTKSSSLLPSKIIPHDIRSSPTSDSDYGYSRSFSMSFPLDASSLMMIDKQRPYDSMISNLIGQDTDTDHMTFKGFTSSGELSDDFNLNISNSNNNNNNNNNAEPLGLRSLHTRLPSTDSGIQADAGFDSLSRYKGKHLLSSTAAATKSDNPVTNSNHPHPPPTSSPTSPQESAISPTQLISPHANSSGYGSDMGASSPTYSNSSRTITSASIIPPMASPWLPSTSINPGSSKPVGDCGKVDKVHHPVSHSCSLSSHKSSPNSGGSQHPRSSSNPSNTHGGIPRQSSVPVVAPKPRVSLSRKPAFIGRGGGGSGVGGSGKQPTLHSGGNDSNTPHSNQKKRMESSPVNKEYNPESFVNNNTTKPVIPPKHFASKNGYSSKSPDRNYENLSDPSSRSLQQRFSENHRVATSSSLSSSSDILSSSGCSSTVGYGIPISSSLLSSSSSSSSRSPTQTHPHTTMADPSNQTVPSSCHLTRPLRLATSSTPSSFSSTSNPANVSNRNNATTNSDKPSKLFGPTRWRNVEMPESIPSCSDTTKNYNYNPPPPPPPQSSRQHLSEERISSKNQNHNNSHLDQLSANNNKTAVNPNHIEATTSSRSYSSPVPKCSPTYVNSTGHAVHAMSPNNSINTAMDQSKTSPISVLTNNQSDSKNKSIAASGSSSFYNFSTKSPTSRNLESSSSSADTGSKTIASPVDSFIFRFKSPETSIFKQTFYTKNSQQEHQKQQQQHYTSSQSPNQNRANVLRRNPKTTASLNPECIMRQTDDILKEALDFFNSREDDEWDSFFSRSSSFDNEDEMDKMFSKFWKNKDDGDEFDKIFSRAFKRRSGSLDVDPGVGVSVDDVDDEICGGSHDNDKMKTSMSKARTGMDAKSPRDPPSLECNINKAKNNVGSGSRSSKTSWKETKQRMDSALSWLQHELADLRALDKSIVCQFRRCQDTITSLQAQRDVWEGVEEEGDYWDDMEISEFNRQCQESPGSSSLSPISTGSRDASMATTDAMWNAMRTGAGVIQDVEAIL